MREADVVTRDLSCELSPFGQAGHYWRFPSAVGYPSTAQ